MPPSSSSTAPNLPPRSVSSVSMTSGSLAGQLWQSGGTPAIQRADGLMLRIDFTGPRLAIASCAFSPLDDNLLCVGDVCGGVFIFHLQKNQFSLVARYAAPVTAVSWVDCGGHIACVCGGSAYIVDHTTARSTSKPMQGPHKRPITRIAVPAVEPRGVLTLVSGDSLSVWRATDLSCLKMITAGSSFADAAMNDDAIYAIEGNHTLRCWTTAGFTHLETMTMREFHFVKIECSNRQLMAATDNGTIIVFHDCSLGSALCAVHMMTTAPIVSLIVNRPEPDGESIVGCVQNDGVVSFASLPPSEEMTEKTAANLVLSFRAMPAGCGGVANANFRLISVFGTKELKLFHLPTAKAAYDKLSGAESVGGDGVGRPPPLNTFISFVQRRGIGGAPSMRASWINATSAGAAITGESDVGRTASYNAAQIEEAKRQQNDDDDDDDNINNKTTTGRGRGVGPAARSNAKPTTKNMQQLNNAAAAAGGGGGYGDDDGSGITNKRDTKLPPTQVLVKSSTASPSSSSSSRKQLQPTRENALRDRMPAPNSESLKHWLKVNLLNSAEATPMGSPVVVGDFAAQVLADRAASAARATSSSGANNNNNNNNNNSTSDTPTKQQRGGGTSSSGGGGGSNDTNLSSKFPNWNSVKPVKFEDTSTVEGILGLRPMMDASSRQQNLDKLRSLLMRYGCFPEKYRGLIWRFLLCLPHKLGMQPYYALLCSKGNHGATASLLQPFPLPNSKLRSALLQALNALAHHAAPFQVAHFVPATVFPFLHVYGTDVQAVIEAVLGFYINWGREFFLYYPHMPVSIASVVSQTLQNEDRQLYDHFASIGLGPEHFVWEPMMALYTEVLSTNEWLQVMDHAFANAPIWLFLFHVRWLIQMRTLLLRVTDHASMLTYFHKATPFDLNVAIQQTYRLQSRYLKSDVTAPYEHLETFPVDAATSSVVYPVEFDCHESVIFTKQEQLREIEEHENQMKIAQRRAVAAERQVKEAAMLEEAFVRRQRALVESKFDAAQGAWEQKILLERERQRLRDVENEARLHAVQEQLRSATRIGHLQEELGAAVDTEEHSATDRAMEAEKWKITEKMTALEMDRMEKAAKMKLATMVHVAGASSSSGPNNNYSAYNYNYNNAQQQQKQQKQQAAVPPAPQRIVAKVIPSRPQQQSRSSSQQQQGKQRDAEVLIGFSAPPAASDADNNNNDGGGRRTPGSTRYGGGDNNNNNNNNNSNNEMLDGGGLSPQTPPPASTHHPKTAGAAASQQQQHQQNQSFGNNNNNNNNNVASSPSDPAVDAMENHHKNARQAYERIQQSQRAARAALRSDFSKASVGAVPLSADDHNHQPYSSDGSTDNNNRQQQQQQQRRGAGGGTVTRADRYSSSGDSGSSVTEHGSGGKCPHGCCSSSSCSCVGTLSEAAPPAPLLPPHSRPLPTLHVSVLPEGGGRHHDGDDDEDE